MAQVIRIKNPGGIEVLAFEDTPTGTPGPGEVLVRQTAIGVNFIDIYHRSGLYKLPAYPAELGMEAAGVVEQAGEGVLLKPGDRVAYCRGDLGGYASHRVMAESSLVKLPQGISEEIAAASILKGLTVHSLIHQTFKLGNGHTALIHAAAGGVGLIMCQWAKQLGATVIASVGSDAKAALAMANGADHAIVHSDGNIPKRVRELTGGKGVDVVYDSVGAATFMDSLDSLRKFGMMVSFGNASGPVPPVEPLLLTKKGSLYLTRPTVRDHIEDAGYYQSAAAELFSMIAADRLKIQIGGRYKLSEAGKAHGDLESRKTTGSLLLIP
jgi:NADPH:quinone reductase